MLKQKYITASCWRVENFLFTHVRNKARLETHKEKNICRDGRAMKKQSKKNITKP
jgi:hypothetical protein